MSEGCEGVCVRVCEGMCKGVYISTRAENTASQAKPISAACDCSSAYPYPY